MATWGEQEKVDEYLGRVDRLEARRAGEANVAALMGRKADMYDVSAPGLPTTYRAP